MQQSQQSIESTSISEDIIQLKSNNYKERATELLSKNDVNAKDIENFSIELRENPLIEIEVKENLLSNETFEIFEKSKLNPIFILNLLNIITIVNFVWNCTKKNIEMFHKILLKLNIMFSYVYNEEQIEYVLLSTIPLYFYELIAEKGKSCFKKEFSFDQDYLSYDKNGTQVGLVYEANTLAQLKYLLNNKELDAPTIMYYLNHNKCIELFQNKIFNQPHNFLNLKYNTDSNHYGYNEIDYSFILKENIEINQNLVLNKVMENNKVIRFFNSKDNNNVIKFQKETNIFIEIKSKFDSSEYIKDLKPNSDRFADAYDNIAFVGIEKKFKKEKSEYYLLYNTNRDDAINKIKNTLNDQNNSIDNNDNNNSNKDINILYNSGYVQIASIVSLQNQIRSINNKIGNMEEKIEKQKNEHKQELEDKMAEHKQELEDKMAEQKKGFEDKMAEQKKGFEDKIEKLNLDIKIFTFITSNLVTLNAIKEILKKIFQAMIFYLCLSK